MKILNLVDVSAVWRTPPFLAAMKTDGPRAEVGAPSAPRRR